MITVLWTVDACSNWLTHSSHSLGFDSCGLRFHVMNKVESFNYSQMSWPIMRCSGISFSWKIEASIARIKQRFLSTAFKYWQHFKSMKPSGFHFGFINCGGRCFKIPLQTKQVSMYQLWSACSSIHHIETQCLVAHIFLITVLCILSINAMLIGEDYMTILGIRWWA